MKMNLDQIHPELRRGYKSMPRVTFNKWSLPFIRLALRLYFKTRKPADIFIQQLRIHTPDGNSIRLKIYKPLSFPGRVPALLWIHGGGFISGIPEMDEDGIFGFVRELGIVIVSVEYRLAPESAFPLPLEDCYTALKWMKDHADELRIDSTCIAIGGASAGGGLAACLAHIALDRGEVKPAFQLLVYPMLDDRTVLKHDFPDQDFFIWNTTSNKYGWESYLNGACGQDNPPAFSIAARRQNLSGLAPAWIGVGTLDLFCEEDMAYADRLRKFGVDCELKVIVGAFHGFDTLQLELPIVRDFRRSQMDAIRKYLFQNSD